LQETCGLYIWLHYNLVLSYNKEKKEHRYIHSYSMC